MYKLTLFWAFTLMAALACDAKAADCDECPQQVSLTSQPMRVSEFVRQLKPNRILLVTTLDKQDRLKEQAVLLRRLASDLRTRSGFDVVESDERICEDCFPIRTGQFDERKLVDLGRKYLVDSVLYCNVQSIDAYRPMRLEIQFLLVNVNQSVSIVSGAQRFDLADPLTEQSYFGSINANPVIDSPLLNSPTRFIDFGASKVADALTALWR